MGTRADFYVGRGKEAEWLGSIAWDGYPSGIGGDDDAQGLLDATNEEAYRVAVSGFLTAREDGTKPDMGWPWPWEDSRTTDFAYAFDDGRVWASCFGGRWFEAWKDGEPSEAPEDDEDTVATFPDMTARSRSVLAGPRSGLIGHRNEAR